MLTIPRAIALLAVGITTFFALFAFRPTPLLGVDGSSLARSVNGDFSSAEECESRARGGEQYWKCFKWDDGQSGGASYRVEVDWWGCWEGRRIGVSASEPGTPRSLSGCVTLLSHGELP